MNPASRAAGNPERRRDAGDTFGPGSRRGVTGLSSAAFLARQGVRCLLVERHPDLLVHPRARGLTPRTVELYRQIGLQAAIEKAGYASGDRFEWVPVRAETLADGTYTAPEEPVEDDESGLASPCTFAPIDQDKLEILLRARSEELGAEVRFSTELRSFEQDDTGVAALLEDRRTGAESRLRTDYLIAADGYDSPVRRALGVDAEGPGPLFHTITAIVEADLRPALRGRRVSIAYLQQPRPFTILMAHDDDGRRWVFGTGYSPTEESLDEFTEARVAEMVRAAAGLPDLKVSLRPQIPGTNLEVLGFPIGAQVARQYRVNRVFLVGDAAHVVPPTGGLGANTGIQDAHNLAWKLSAVLAGRARPSLLATYQDERRPVGLLTMQQALARFGTRMTSQQSDPLIPYSALVFGYGYRSSAVVGAEQDATPLPPRELTAQPGTRAPHRTVTLEGRTLSTLDLYGRKFVLLAAEQGAAWISAAQHVTQRLNVPMDAYRFGEDLTEAEGASAHGLGADGAVLVRPDGFVAWRSATLSDGSGGGDPAAELERALRAVLGR
jgi:putative polyketide hydroxylase